MSVEPHNEPQLVTTLPPAGQGRATFGWGAPPMAEQFPSLSAKDAKKFDDLNRSIIMCHLHGLISDSARDSAIRKCTRQIEKAATHTPGAAP